MYIAVAVQTVQLSMNDCVYTHRNLMPVVIEYTVGFFRAMGRGWIEVGPQLQYLLY